MKNRKKPYQGIRLIEQYNIDLVYNMIKREAGTRINSSLIIDVEVVMLPKRSTAVVNYLKNINRRNFSNK